MSSRVRDSRSPLAAWVTPHRQQLARVTLGELGAGWGQSDLNLRQSKLADKSNTRCRIA